jgi:hypothetical protein
MQEAVSTRQKNKLPKTPLRTISLTTAEKARLQAVLEKPAVSGASPEKIAGLAPDSVLPRLHVRARVVLKLAEWDAAHAEPKTKMETLTAIAAAAGCTVTTVYTVHRLYTSGGLDAVLTFKGPKVMTAAVEKRILALRRRRPPAGHPRWTAALLAEAAVKEGIAERVTLMTVTRILRADAARRGEGEGGRRQESYVQKVTPAVEKRILALSRTAPPAGAVRWTGSLLAAEVVKAGIVPEISSATIGKVLRKAAGPGWKRPPTRRPSPYPVVLSAEERAALDSLVKESTVTQRVKLPARILLLLSQHPAGLPPDICIYTDTEVARITGCTKLTVHNVRRRFCESGLASALNMQPPIPPSQPASSPSQPGINVPVKRSVYAEITLKNAADMIREKEGSIKESEIRQTTVRALVDPGAWTPAINEAVRKALEDMDLLAADAQQELAGADSD